MILGKISSFFKKMTIVWEQRKVGDLYDFKNGLNKGKEFFGAGTAIVNFTDVFHKRGLTYENLMGKVTLDTKEIKNYEVRKGDIFFTRTSETIEEIGFPSVMLDSPEDTVFSGFVLRGRSILKEDPLDNLFKKYVFFTNAFRNEMIKKSSMTTRALTSGTAIKSMEFFFPKSKEEQKKIGSFFTQLDNLITLHQRKFKFKKFFLTNVWEQRKFGDMVRVYDGVHQTPEYQDSGIMFLSVENITTMSSEKYISQESFERDYKVYPEKGDILMTRIGDIGTTNVVETTEKVAFYVSLALLKPHDANSYFLSNAMQTDSFQKGLRERSLLTAIPKKINKDEIGKVNITVTPNLKEQEKIGNYFTQLDNLITLHQWKCDFYKKYNANVWEQRKFNQVFHFLQNNALSRADLDDKGNVMNVHYGDILVKYGEVLDITQSELTYLKDDSFADKYENSFLKNGDIIFADAAEDETVGKCSEIAGLSEEIVLSGLHTIPCRTKEKYAKGYLGYYLNSNAYHKQLLPLMQGTKVSSISKSAIQDTKIKYPKSEKEQELIGLNFEHLDNLITLHQYKF